MQTRYISHVLREDLEKEMVFSGGPRQIGKTTLASFWLQNTLRTYLK